MADRPISYEDAVGSGNSNDSGGIAYEDAAGSNNDDDSTSARAPWSDLPSNIGPSFGRFVGNVTYPVMHPKDFIEGIQKVATDPETQKAVIQYYKDRYGSLDNVRNTTIRDPVGIAADLAGLLSGGEFAVGKAASTLGKLGAVRAADAVGAAGKVIGGVGSAIDPVANTGRALSLGKFAAGKTYSGVLGLTTLKGADAISDAAEAGFRGNSAFLSNLNKKVPVESLTDSMENAVGLAKQAQHSYYQSNFPTLKNPISTTSIHDAWADLMGTPKITETPGSAEQGAWSAMTGAPSGVSEFQPTTRAARPVTDFTTESGLLKGSPAFGDQTSAIKALIDKYTTKKQSLWVEDPKAAPIQRSDGSTMQPGSWQDINVPQPRNVFDLDALKQALGQMQGEVSHPQSQLVIGKMRDAVKAAIEDVHPEYANTMEKYAKAEQMLRDIRQTFSIGNNRASVNTQLNKIGKIYGESASGQRSAELFDELEKQTGVPLRAQVAGQRLGSWFPVEGKPAELLTKMFLGKEAAAAVGAKALAAVPFMSPKLAGLGTYGANRAAGAIARGWDAVGMPSPRTLGQVSVQVARPSELANDPEEVARIRAEQAAGIQ